MEIMRPHSKVAFSECDDSVLLISIMRLIEHSITSFLTKQTPFHTRCNTTNTVVLPAKRKDERSSAIY